MKVSSPAWTKKISQNLIVAVPVNLVSNDVFALLDQLVTVFSLELTFVFSQ